MIEPLTPDTARDRLRDATRIILDKERDYEHAVERAADAEAIYRSQLGEKFKTYRDAGKGVEEATTLARADVVTLVRERDYSAGMLKLAGEKLENARDSRRSLWRLIEWASRRDTANLIGAVRHDATGSTVKMPENVPNSRWP